MTSRIQTLPTEVVHLIAAGEVIDSLAAVVRELAENAIDAGATRITVSLWLEQWRVRVADNGTGMELADLQQAATPHSTSKIRDRQDLWQIHSLGFRGEALHSLSQLASLDICSRRAEANSGWRIAYDTQGEPVQVEAVAIAPGTIVTVSDLFKTIPTRRQGLPTPAQQLRAVQTTIQHIALCHPHITWQVEQSDRPWFSIWANHSPQQILPQFLREVQPGDLRESEFEGVRGAEEGLGGWGLGARDSEVEDKNLEPEDQNPEFQVQNSALQALSSDFPVQTPELLGQNKNIPIQNENVPVQSENILGQNKNVPVQNKNVLVQNEDILGENKNVPVLTPKPAIQTSNLKSQTSALTPSPQPPAPSLSSLLLLGLPDRCHRHRPDWVKVAINGRVVKVAELEQTILAAFRRTLPRDRHPVCFLHLQVAPEQIDWNRHPAKSEIYLHQMTQWQEIVTEAIAQTLTLTPNALAETAHSQRVTNLLKTAEAQGAYNSNPQSPTPTPQSQPLTPLKAIAQVHNMYILAEHPSGMWLIEQHIAHERVLYERLCDRWQLVPLEPPVILNQLSKLQREQLQRLQLEVELFGENLWAVRTAPEPLALREDRAEALIELSLGGNLESALVATACRTAIRNGTPLGLTEMQTLLDQWQQTRHPRTCPHGRPIYLSLEESSLSRFFRRHWVIGKSHGI
ncbi:DNA mismatch repair endonuclease MutL [Leptolyngbya sp. FACHB-671]|uniref:DNA mismatch repair endonuclease MutL n=1 Tax=Leptolyngbya sp. FACHB-671 TaxID=2692812 RepID=UPI001F5568B3|nr:DNA mismatch repair endonuclease MutL [Leptolyngbya sp. FACHB-671]